MKGMKKSHLIALTLIILTPIALGVTGHAYAAEKEFPTREINIYIGFPPGGSQDITGRVIKKVLEKFLGVPVVVINKPGASGAVSASFVANSKPDGYTLDYMLNPFPLIKKIEEPSLPYGPDELTLFGFPYEYYHMLAVRADSPWKTYEDFVEYAKQKEIKFGCGGTPQEYNQIEFAQRVGLKMTLVPFGGGGPAVRALLGGHVDAITVSSGPTGPYVRSGDFRWLVYFGPARNKVYNDIPSIKEKGLALYSGGWTLFSGPKGIPDPIAKKLQDALDKAAETEEVKELFRKFGWDYRYRTAKESYEQWKEEEGFYKEWMKKRGLIK